MIVVDNVKFGIQPFGPGSGQSMFSIYFKDDGTGGINLDCLDEKKDFNKIRDKFAEIANNLYKSIKENTSVQLLDSRWKQCMENRSPTYIGLIGNVLATGEYFYPICMLNDLISKESADIQKGLMQAHIIDALRAPMFAIIADAIYPYIKLPLYEACNFAIGRLSVKKELDNGEVEYISDKNFHDFYHPNSLMGINNHTFGCFVFEPTEENDLDLFKKNYLETFNFKHSQSIFLIPAADKNSDKDFLDKCREFTIANNIRYGMKLDGSQIVNFDQK